MRRLNASPDPEALQSEAGNALSRAYDLVLNGFEIAADVDDAENVILTLAAGELSREELLEWVTSHIRRLPT